MATNLGFEEKLLNKELKAGRFKTRKVAVNTALGEFIQRRRPRDIVGIFEIIDSIESISLLNYK